MPNFSPGYSQGTNLNSRIDLQI